jgi:hypothetical protein
MPLVPAAVAIIAALAAAGCKTSSGFDRGPIRERLPGERPQISAEDADIARALAARPQVRLPMRVAVLLTAGPLERAGDAGRGSGHSCWAAPPQDDSARWPADRFWRVGDEAAIGAWADPLRARGVVSDVFVVPDGLKPGSTVRDARLAAARCGADAVFVLGGASRVESRVNALAALNLLVVPGWLVPASHRDATVVLRGVLYDVANEYVYMATAEGEGSIVRPTFRVRGEEAVRLAREKALADLGREFERRLAGLKS